MNDEPVKGEAAIFVITLIAMFLVAPPWAASTLLNTTAFLAVVAIGAAVSVWNEERQRAKGSNPFLVPRNGKGELPSA